MHNIPGTFLPERDSKTDKHRILHGNSFWDFPSSSFESRERSGKIIWKDFCISKCNDRGTDLAALQNFLFLSALRTLLWNSCLYMRKTEFTVFIGQKAIYAVNSYWASSFAPGLRSGRTFMNSIYRRLWVSNLSTSWKPPGCRAKLWRASSHAITLADTFLIAFVWEYIVWVLVHQSQTAWFETIPLILSLRSAIGIQMKGVESDCGL